MDDFVTMVQPATQYAIAMFSSLPQYTMRWAFYADQVPGNGAGH